jgi:hypothetical protein
VQLHGELRLHQQQYGPHLLHERVLRLQDERGLPQRNHLRRDLSLLPLITP